jgi:hypothetical protein
MSRILSNKLNELVVLVFFKGGEGPIMPGDAHVLTILGHIWHFELRSVRLNSRQMFKICQVEAGGNS